MRAARTVSGVMSVTFASMCRHAARAKAEDAAKVVSEKQARTAPNSAAVNGNIEAAFFTGFSFQPILFFIPWEKSALLTKNFPTLDQNFPMPN